MADRARKLSKYFRLGDLLVDASFPALALDLEPNEAQIANLVRLTEAIDRVIDRFGGRWMVLSGFRNDVLNEACRRAGLPASIDSLHLDGCAADLKPDNTVDLEAVYEWISHQSRIDLAVHEAVYYPKKAFIHVAVQSPNKLTAKRIIMRT